MYVSEGCQPTNRLFYVDLTKLDRTPQGTINFAAYDFFKGEPIMTHILTAVLVALWMGVSKVQRC